jgi:K(+)-stimulated pyrophosphate-energized sodium pump
MIERITEYFTSTEKKPVKEISAAASTGPATLIIQGFAYGLESSVWAMFRDCVCTAGAAVHLPARACTMDPCCRSMGLR